MRIIMINIITMGISIEKNLMMIIVVVVMMIMILSPPTLK